MEERNYRADGANQAKVRQFAFGDATLKEPGIQVIESPLDKAKRLMEADAAHRSLAADQTLMLTILRSQFEPMLAQLAEGVNRWFDHQGFGNSSKSEMIALEHTELSGRLEAVRNGDFANEEEEVADAFIRLLHYCGKHRVQLGSAFFAKMLANYERPFRHGKEF